MNIANTCAKELVKCKISSRPLLVSITGDSGSGKSYYSKLIRAELEKMGETYTYIDADTFLISRADREPMKTEFYTEGEFKGKSKWEILENMFRLDEFKRVIDLLRKGEAVSYHPYFRETGKVEDKVSTVFPAPIIIFDSSMLTEEMDLIIRIDVDQEKIIERKIERDKDIRTPEEIEKMHRNVQGYYWSRKMPKNPHILIDNNDYANPKIEVIQS